MSQKKHLLLSFLSFFAIGTVAGYLHGSGVDLDPDILKWKIVTSLKLLPDKGILIYFKDERAYWVYDIDSNKGEFADPSSEIVALSKGATTLPVDAKVAEAFVGGSASAWTVKDIVKALAEKDVAKRRDPRQIVAAIAGGLIGYTGGYYAGRWQGSYKEEYAITSFLKDRNNFREIERLSFALLYKAKNQEIENSIINDMKTRINIIKQHHSDKTYKLQDDPVIKSIEKNLRILLISGKGQGLKITISRRATSNS
jgi:hypothetical protein